jgi:hypothetical protein
MDRCITNI